MSHTHLEKEGTAIARMSDQRVENHNAEWGKVVNRRLEIIKPQQEEHSDCFSVGFWNGSLSCEAHKTHRLQESSYSSCPNQGPYNRVPHGSRKEEQFEGHSPVALLFLQRQQGKNGTRHQKDFKVTW